ncbi:MAG: hypothetical protein NTX65_02215 [Ignavibacteriales bacterium]|nr:hypothetical protein [Ignavibacteriales bacterium]
MAKKDSDKSIVDASRKVYEALELFDEQEKKRIISSVLSLFGMEKDVLNSPINTAPVTTSGNISIRSQSVGSDRPLSPLELIQQKKPSTNMQRLAVFAYYREKHEGISRFSRNDLRPYFAKAKLNQPKNFDRDFSDTIKLGYIYEDGSESYLTSKGLESVETGFNSSRSSRSKNKR